MPRRSPGRRSAPRTAAGDQIDALSFAALRSLAENTEASPQALALLAYDPLTDVRVAVAWNPRTPAVALAQLATGPVEVQAGVAQNPSTAPEVLERLAGHGDALVRSAAATNLRLPLPLLFALGQDADPRVRLHVARNPLTPYRVLVQLARDPDPEVRRTAGDEVRAWEE